MARQSRAAAPGGRRPAPTSAPPPAGGYPKRFAAKVHTEAVTLAKTELPAEIA